MSADLNSDKNADIVADNVRAVGVMYFAYQLDQVRIFDVVERIVELFQQGLLPLNEGAVGKMLQDYGAPRNARISKPRRSQLYAMVLGVPGGDSAELESNREFLSLWLKFVSSVALFARQQSVKECNQGVISHERIRRSASALAVNASAWGRRVLIEAQQLADDVKMAFELLNTPEMRNAFGARDLWQVVDDISSYELGGGVNSARHRAMSLPGRDILDWIAGHADQLSATNGVGQGSSADDHLIDAVEKWLAANDVDESFIERLKRLLASELPPRNSLHLGKVMRNLLTAFEGAASHENLRSPEDNNVVVFSGARGTGKTLSAYLLGAAMSRDVFRIDLNEVVSKYIGETEKDLSRLFAAAQNADAVLLIEEADALFGRDDQASHNKSNALESSNDALRRSIEAYRGVVIIERTAHHSDNASSPMSTVFRRPHPVIAFPGSR